jgi:glycine betaine/choline ABC-type transport system substrate-binding protein
VPVIRGKTVREYPEVERAIGQLAEKISDEDMRRLNYAVDGQHRDVKEVARDFLHSKGLAP